MQREQRSDPGDGDGPSSNDAASDTDEPLDDVDEQGLESFPASDPPEH